MSLAKGYKKIVERYRGDPIGWIEKFISFEGLEHNGLTEQQKEICRAFLRSKRIAVSSGGGTGKSALMAMLIQWFLFCNPGTRIPCTAPTYRQLMDVLFGEIEKWLRRNVLKDFYELRRGKLFIKGYPEWYCVARTVPKDNKAVNGTLAGFHSNPMLIVVDEAADVPDGVYTALDGAMTNDDCYIILISNPVSTGGYFFDTITDPEGKGKGFEVLHLSSAESPLVSKEYVEMIKRRYGEDSAMYKAKVLGLPITTLENSVVSPLEFDRLVAEQKDRQGGRVVVGLDYGGNDYTVLCWKQGNSVFRWDVLEKTSKKIVLDILERGLEKFYGKDVCVVVDGVGEGAGFAEDLEVMPRWFDVKVFKGSKASERNDMFKNQRAEIYYYLKKGFKDLHWPVEPPERLKKELCNLFFLVVDGPIEMEPKKRFVGRLGFSPDHADALAMTFFTHTYVRPSTSMVSKVANVITNVMLQARGDEGRGKFL